MRNSPFHNGEKRLGSGLRKLTEILHDSPVLNLVTTFELNIIMTHASV